jgi:hypothetical protein
MKKVTSNAQNLTLKFYQASTEVNVNFTIEKTAKDSLLIGTALNELFTMRDNYANAGLKLFKSNEPLLFSVSNEDTTLLDVGMCQKTILHKLKLNKTAKSKRAFAKRVNLAITEIKREVVAIDYTELTNKLNAIID